MRPLAHATAWLSCCSDEDAINQTLQLIEIFILSAGAGGMCQALRGILNGCGLQAVNAKISMFSGYVIGLPLSALLCYGLTVDDTEFVAARGVFGLWVVSRTILLASGLHSSKCAGNDRADRGSRRATSPGCSAS